MPKVLCWTGIVISGLVALLFLADLVLGMIGQIWLAPFRYTSLIMDILFLVSAAVLGTLSFLTLQEQD